MAKFAPVMPINVAEGFSANGELGHYHLLLAHDVVEHPERYKALYVDHHEPRGTIILDNSASELGDSVSLDVMQKARDIVDPNVIILPDCLMDMHRTTMRVLAALESKDNWREAFAGVQLMAVPQGKNYFDFIYCVKTLAEHEGIDWLGIPRNLRRKLSSSRHLMCDMINDIYPDIKIHLLGMSGDLEDDLLAATDCRVEGMDSSAPVYLGMRDHLTVPEGVNKFNERMRWWDEAKVDEDFINLFKGIDNVNYIRKVFLNGM